ncbi:nucleotidyltransferase family protein [Fibrella forsythiae]|uniref:Nucleotidyltransferase family protein n=1 Tax=Fibrella forsythiae TaxID=2817061 RepID=A0ABS3JCA1_9BACT|nr:nucleotidyltransferase family protein [Fibrella forsythiae]MBO0947610.1 nucleotidyltransferase family protein [Fibrella forsythiae]
MKTGIIVLAAGSSKRFGGIAKQLLTINGTSLVRNAAQLALAADLGGPVVVVLGDRREQVAPELDGLGVTLIDNPTYTDGIATSVRIGLAGLFLMQPTIESFIVMPCDQPFVTPALLKQLVATQLESGKGMVATRYADQVHMPALFKREYAEPLSKLTEDKAPKWVIIRHKADLAEVRFEPAAIDLDFWAQVEELNK